MARDWKRMGQICLAGVLIGAPGMVSGATLVGQLGALDLTANGGLNPATGAAWQVGDTYRLVFVTSTTGQATSTNIADYNNFVQTAAGLSSNPDLGNGTWNVVGATQTVGALANTGTTGAGGEAILLVDGSTVIANNYPDFWNGHTIGTQDINLDESGVSVPAGQVFTGIASNGSTVADRYFGTTTLSNNQFRVTRGVTNPNTTGRWAQQFNNPPTANLRFYALSDPLTVGLVPEPTRALLLGLGLVGLTLRRQRSKN